MEEVRERVKAVKVLIYRGSIHRKQGNACIEKVIEFLDSQSMNTAHGWALRLRGVCIDRAGRQSVQNLLDAIEDIK